MKMNIPEQTFGEPQTSKEAAKLRGDINKSPWEGVLALEPRK